MTTTTSTTTVAVGDQAPPRTYPPLTRTDFVKYQGASGDFHPLHHDETFARETGFPSVFSVGMLQAGMLASYATEWLGVENLRRFKIRFAEKVWPGDELTCSATVVEVWQAADGRRARVEVTCARQTGVAALVGDAEFLLD
ncbi:MaoC/PaaZ C-terminal domain-containing protein [Rhodococcus sp. NPDC127528]|uniref:MaoC/PaaZ C-terminal domain-containing protein n=1 Tax=unclassified Rhodococcus (in: high G+C Gram-positive bacteria) TaxID=192944 RepID=UPI003630968E